MCVGGGHTSTGARDEALHVVGVAATIRVAVVVARWEETKKFCDGDVGQGLVVIELVADAGLVGSRAPIDDSAVGRSGGG